MKALLILFLVLSSFLSNAQELSQKVQDEIENYVKTVYDYREYSIASIEFTSSYMKFDINALLKKLKENPIYERDEVYVLEADRDFEFAIKEYKKKKATYIMYYIFGIIRADDVQEPYWSVIFFNKNKKIIGMETYYP